MKWLVVLLVLSVQILFLAGSVDASVCDGFSSWKTIVSTTGTVWGPDVYDTAYDSSYFQACLDDCEANGADTCRFRVQYSSPVDRMTCTGFSGGTVVAGSNPNLYAASCSSSPPPPPPSTVTIDSFRFTGAVTQVGGGPIGSAYINQGAVKGVSWTSTGATNCTGNGWKDLAAEVDGSDPGWVTTSTSETRQAYTLTCNGPGGTDIETIYLHYVPKITLFSLAKSDIAIGELNSVSWNVQNALNCFYSINTDQPNMENVDWKNDASTSGSQPLPATGSRTYRLYCDNGYGFRAATTTAVTVHPAPTIDSVEITPDVISPQPSGHALVARNTATTITYATTGATSCDDNGTGWLAGSAPSGSDSGLSTSNPSVNRIEQRLKCTGPGGSVGPRIVYTYILPSLSIVPDKSSIIYGETNGITFSTNNSAFCHYNLTAGPPPMHDIDWKVDNSVNGYHAVPYEGARSYRLYCDNGYGHSPSTWADVTLANTWFCDDTDGDGYYEGKSFQATPTASYPVLCTDVDPSCTGDPDLSCGKSEISSCDGNATRNPGVAETCDNIDNDCDGVVDGEGICFENCGNGVYERNGDTYTDEADSECAISLSIVPNPTTTNAWTPASQLTANIAAADGSLYPAVYRVCDYQGCTPTGTCANTSICSTTSGASSCTFGQPESDGNFLYSVCIGENNATTSFTASCTTCANAVCPTSTTFQNCTQSDADSCLDQGALTTCIDTDANECTYVSSVCSGMLGSCKQDNYNVSGTTCGGGSNVCDGAGSCVECVTNSSCTSGGVCGAGTCAASPSVTLAEETPCQIPTGSATCSGTIRATITDAWGVKVFDSSGTEFVGTANVYTVPYALAGETYEAYAGCVDSNPLNCGSGLLDTLPVGGTCQSGNQNAGVCVECIQASDCSLPAAPICEPTTNSCVQCTASNLSICALGESCVASSCAMVHSNVTVTLLPSPVPGGRASYYMDGPFPAQEIDSTSDTYKFENVPRGDYLVSALAGEFYAQALVKVDPPASEFVTLNMEKSFCSDSCTNEKNLCTYSCYGSACNFNLSTTGDHGLGYWASQLSSSPGPVIDADQLSQLMRDRCYLAPAGSKRSVPGYPGSFFNCCGAETAPIAPIVRSSPQPATIEGCPDDIIKTVTIARGEDQQLLNMNVVTWSKCET